MNRKAFFRSLILGGIILPTLPRKLILTGGWLAVPNAPTTWLGYSFSLTADTPSAGMVRLVQNGMYVGAPYHIDPETKRMIIDGGWDK